MPLTMPSLGRPWMLSDLPRIKKAPPPSRGRAWAMVQRKGLCPTPSGEGAVHSLTPILWGEGKYCQARRKTAVRPCACMCVRVRLCVVVCYR